MVLESFKKGRGVQRLLDYAFYQVAAINGFDSFGHYLRARLILNTCSRYYTKVVAGCSSKFAASASQSSAVSASAGGDERRPDPRAHLRRPRRQGPRQRRAGADPATPQAEPRADRGPGAQPGRRPGPAPAPAAEPRLRRFERGRQRTRGSRHRPAPGLPLRQGQRMRSRGSSIAGNPVLIGAATVLVIIVAMFLSYNANAGLPFVPTYQLKVEAPSAAALVKGNEVRIGGSRVGAVDTITTRRRKDGTSVALIGMKLERAVSPLPKDSTIIIRPKSALGLKYVEITRGTSKHGYQDGDTIPGLGVEADRGRVRRVREHVRRQDAPGDAAEPARLRRRARGPRLEHQRRARRAAGAAARHPARRPQPVQPRHGPQALLQRARRRRADRRPRRRDAGEPVREPRHDVHRARRGRAPVHPGLDHRGPPRARLRHPLLPGPAAVPAQHAGPVPRAAPRRALAAHRGARPRVGADGRHAHAAPLARAQPPPRVAADRAAQSSPTTRSRRAASSGWRRRSRRSSRRSTTWRRPSCSATT